MNISVDKHSVCIKDRDDLNKGEYNIHKCNFTFSEEYENLTLVAVFSNRSGAYEVNIENNECSIPYDVLKDEGIVELGVYGYSEENSELKLRYSPEPCRFKVEDGSYIQDGSSPSAPEVSRYLMPENIKQGSNIIISRNGNDITINSYGGGSGGDAILKEDLNVSNPLGKYANGDKIDAGTELETIFRGILSKTYYPTLTPPSCALSYSADVLYKVGAMITAKAATVSLNRGSINPKYNAESQYRSGEATGYSISLSGASVEYSDNNTTGSFNVPEFTRNSKGNVVINASASYEAGCQPYDSDGNKYESPLPAGSKSASKTIEFILPFYYGASDVSDITSLAGLTEDLSRKGNKTYKITTATQHLVIVYDSSYGDLTSIVDANNFELIDGWTKTTKTIEGQSYNVWVSNGKTIDTNAQFTFKF